MTCAHSVRVRLSPQWHACCHCWQPVVTLVDVLEHALGYSSRQAAKRDIKSGAVQVSGRYIKDPNYTWAPFGEGLRYALEREVPE